jgi:hypothetical protein
LLPLFIGLWFQGKGAKTLALVGGASACAIGVAASSGGALLTMVMGGVGFGFWRMRQRMRLVRRSMLALMVVLTIVMNAPVWYLIARVSSITGGTGWHRAWLIDVALAHFGEWCVFGTTYTAHWGGEAQILDDDPDNIDITNQFVFEGVRGGMARLALFVAIIVQCFKAVGRRTQVEAARSLEDGMRYWAIGVTLLTHCVAFWSVLYYDQLGVMWFWLLAVISRVVCDEEADPARLADQVSLESASRESPLADQDLVIQ